MRKPAEEEVVVEAEGGAVGASGGSGGIADLVEKEEAVEEGLAAYDGSFAISDGKREAWCQAVSSGEDKYEAYQRLFRVGAGLVRMKTRQCAAAVGRLKKREDVKLRLGWLRKELAKEARIDKAEKLKITEEVIQGLREDFARGERGKVVSDLMLALQRHDAMTGEVEKPTLEVNFNFGAFFGGLDAVVEGRLRSEGISLPSFSSSGLPEPNLGQNLGVKEQGEVVELEDLDDSEGKKGKKGGKVR